MLNLNRKNELIELGCRTWWPEKKKGVRPTEHTARPEESLPVEQFNHDRRAAVPPESVFFAIEFA